VLERIYLALDFPDKTQAENLLKKLPQGLGVKIGLELFLKEGLDFVKKLKNAGYNIFLDLKFHDIPRTVFQAVSQVAASCDLLNVHATGGIEMLKAAKEASLNTAKPPKLLGVTVLTSINAEIWSLMGGQGTIAEAVKKRALLCYEAGLDGVVASTLEVPLIKAVCGERFLTVVPGIRPHGEGLGDQKRVATPKEAIKKGADYLVIGRPITKASDPVKALEVILKEIKEDGRN